MSLIARIRDWIDRPRPTALVGVDRAARDRMARLVRALATRKVDIAEFERSIEDLSKRAPDDPVIAEIADECWLWCSEVYGRRLPRLNREQRQAFARMVLFLRSDFPYRWDHSFTRMRMFRLSDQLWNGLLAFVLGFWVPLISAIRLLLWYVQRSERVLLAPREPDHAARDRVWPFPDDESCAMARRTHYLLGRASLQ